MWDELFDLKGKRAVVTGGSSGIGLAIAQALGRAGVQVAIVNRNPEAGAKAAAGLKEEGLVVASYAADVTDEGQVREAFARIEDEQGPTDILINSHGINIRKPVFEFSLDEWRKIIEINLTGSFITCQTMGRAMVGRGSGSIVNVSSIVSFVGRVGLGPYSASKGGITQLTKTLALEWVDKGVRVNAIGPGFVRTPLTEAMVSQPSFQAELDKYVPMRRVAETDELLGIVLVLAGKAGSYITGQTILVDGGWSIA